ncbi:MAG: YwaF family protein [Clostridia bacterium]|nr:YwaF family protein [Clostridia bacterium]
MFFAKPGEYEPCGMYTSGHIILLVITLTTIVVALQCTKKYNTEQIRAIIKKSTITLWILEIIKIIFNLAVGHANNPNHYVPLYYCSIILYAGVLSSYAKGVLKKVGDVFIAVGAIVGGGFFLSCPNTSITMYPLFHYLSIQSFVFHGTMVYLGILVNITDYVDLKITDLKYYASLLAVMLVVSYFVNKALETNFMFISKNFPDTPVDVIYKLSGNLFTPVMCVLHMILPFGMVYPVRKLAIKLSQMKKAMG